MPQEEADGSYARVVLAVAADALNALGNLERGLWAHLVDHRAPYSEGRLYLLHLYAYTALTDLYVQLYNL